MENGGRIFFLKKKSAKKFLSLVIWKGKEREGENGREKEMDKIEEKGRLLRGAPRKA